MARTCDYCGKVGCYSKCKAGKDANMRRYYIKNREDMLLRNNERYKNNKSEYITRTRTRQQIKIIRQFDHEKESLDIFYGYADVLNRDCPGFNYVVDHVVPLIHPDVCGLHVLANLQLVPYAYNASKGNKFL